MDRVATLLTNIAREHLGFDTLETTRSTADFRETAVWCAERALTEAYWHGRRDAETAQHALIAQLAASLTEALAEIEYHHADMLSESERRHPRGSGWARVYDHGHAALALALAAAA